MSDKPVDFVPLIGYENEYEILNEYPFTIRRKSDGYEFSEYDNGYGYITVKLNRRQIPKHVLIAKQFIPNDDPDHKTQVDHINRHRDDYHIENLRWVTPSQNSINKSSNRGVVYQYVDDIPDEAMVVDFYDTRNGHHEFENYFFHDDVFYLYNGVQYRILHINENKSGNKYVNLLDINRNTVAVMYSRFKKQHDL